jgi:hypothetical protein
MSKAIPHNPDITLSYDLPVTLKCAIADCITLYSKVESCIVETLWAMEAAKLERRKEIARNWGNQNSRAIRKLIKSLPGAETDAIWPALNRLMNDRNIIGHGVWMIGDDDRPRVVWHAKFLESDEWVGAEFFDWPRFDYFLDTGSLLLKTFAELREIIEREVNLNNV